MASQIKEIDYLKTWAAFSVCAAIVGLIAGAIVGGILGAMLGMAGTPIPTIQVICGIAGFIVGLPISYFFFRLFVSQFIVRKLTELRESENSQLA